MKSVIPLILALLALNSCICQQKSKPYEVSSRLLNSPVNFFSQSQKYLDWQSQNLLEMTEEVFSKYPPKVKETMERHMALLMLDAVFHDVEAPNRSSVQDFHKRRTLKAFEEMKKTKVDRGAVIWKLYDMGVIVRTKSATVAFDVIRGKSAKSDNFTISDSLMNEIIKQCDILFISHNHGDHADKWVAQRFVDQGKPVLANEEVLKGEAVYDKIIHPEREIDKSQSIAVQSGSRKLEFIVYPGHQGALLNNVTIVKMPEGISVCHTGDQSFRNDFKWIDTVGSHHKIDVLIPNCWTTDPSRAAKGYNPKLIITAHENELGHTIDHREAYTLNYSRWNNPYPKLFMTWGESYLYQP